MDHPSRRLALAGPVAALALVPRLALAKQRSYAATHGAAPFATEHLIPGDSLDLAAVNLSSSAARVVALTIDDGPDSGELRMLDALHEQGAQATFFSIGHKVAEHAEILRRVTAAGHEVGNHTQDHPMMTDLQPAEMLRNLDAATAALATAGVRPVWFRPPYGDFDAAVVRAAAARGMRTILWTVDSRDWKGSDSETITRRVSERLSPGAVVLMHGTKAASVEALPRILAEGTRQGYRFVTLSGWRAAMAAAAVRTTSAVPHAAEGGRRS